jgi:leukotriene-A4 hydrolase
MARLDPHSFADDQQPRTASFDWNVVVDFAARRLIGSVTLVLAAPATSDGPFDLDTRDLDIEAVSDGDGHALAFVVHPPVAVLGSRLEVQLKAGTRAVHIRYRTSDTASALQWLEPAQTLGKQQPFLFSQCQAIHARSIVPCQDTPSLRVTWTAALTVPAGLTVVMAAAAAGHEDHTFRWSMPQPIPPYLLAFAVGDIASRDLSPRCRVWAEPGILDAAAWEFADVEHHIAAAEALFGPYDWERFDMLVMPPSFPYGGMENPRLTFLTPSLIAGDRSMVNVVAHELAHSWTGNLVTNTTAEHFWLNEGFTVFAERRILEALEGPDMAALHAAIGRLELDKAIARFADQPDLTRLRTHLDGIDPDEAFSVVPYEKGYLFLKALEQKAGRAAFDRLLQTWLSAHRFGAANTDQLLALVERELPGVLAAVKATAWIDGPGVPDDAPVVRSARLDAVRALRGTVPAVDATAAWSPTEWQLFLEDLPRPVHPETCAALDARFALTARRNTDVLVAWLTAACEAGFAPAVERASTLLGELGRMKYLKPLYQVLASRDETRARARALFERHRAGYHPIAQQVIAGVLARAGA